MFSMNDFQKAVCGIGGIEREVLFSLSKNPVSYSMSLLNNKDRGTRMENMIGNRLRADGFEVQRVGNFHGFDLLINNHLRVEVKCATIRDRDSRYIIQKVKPESFDVMFMVFIAPETQVIKWTTQEMVSIWAYNRVRREQGYNIWFSPSINNNNLIYNDNYHTFLKEYGGCETACV